MSKEKFLFIDRDGTLIDEPDDKQVDTLEKLQFEPYVIPSLLQLQKRGYRFVMVTNQNGIGRPSFPQVAFDVPHAKMMAIFQSQGVEFEAVKVCPHLPEDHCDCRKPKVGMVLDYINSERIDRAHSYVIGDRQTDLQLAQGMGIQGILYTDENGWPEILETLLQSKRTAHTTRKTKETHVEVKVNLDADAPVQISTGIGFFDHMLEQLAKHAGMSLVLSVQGDLHIDEHHTVEDAALTLGEALRMALGDKIGIARYGFVLPMDEASAQVALDLSGRAYLQFDATFHRESVGGLPTELVSHFFHSLVDALKATLHVQVRGDNTHHMIEALFKGVGRVLRQAIAQVDDSLPSTKGQL